MAHAAPSTLFAVLLAASLPAAFAQPAPTPAQAAPKHITLDVVVTPKSGAPVSGLDQSDFTILDNKTPRSITSFKALGAKQQPVEVILVVDAVNTTYTNVGYERLQIEKFLRADGGHLAYPTSLASFTDAGIQAQKGFFTDGNELSASLDQANIGLREVRRSAGFWGADDRLSLSLNSLQSLAANESALPGRKIILWISPGWPYLSGPSSYYDDKTLRQIFAQIVALSTQLRNGRITLYSVDPVGTAQGVGSQNYYQTFLKGIAKPDQVELGDLALQVLSVQSGGLALTGNNDISAMLKRCLADTTAYYELTFDALPADHPDEYHRLEVRVAKPGLSARTRASYYAQP